MKRVLAFLPDKVSTSSAKRLKEAFGDYVHGVIIWESVLPRGCVARSKAFRVNLDHIVHALVDQRPSLILTFGNSAKEALFKCSLLTPIWSCHHPDARFVAEERLQEFADRVKRYVDDQLAILPINKVAEQVVATEVENTWRCCATVDGTRCILPKNHGLWHYDGIYQEWKDK